MCHPVALLIWCQVIGVMITASHNGIEDNGVKMIDADGGMLAREWEKVRRGGK